MAKAKAHPDQFGFCFKAPLPATSPAELAGLEQQISRAAGTILNSDPRSRAVIAAEMSELLGEEVSSAMLDAYASPARREHKVIMSRFLALVAVCERHDVLDQVLRPIGGALLVGEELHTARIGHIRQQIAQLSAELKLVERQAPLIREGRTK